MGGWGWVVSSGRSQLELESLKWMSLFPIRVPPGVLVILFPVSGKAGTWRSPGQHGSREGRRTWIPERATQI